MIDLLLLIVLSIIFGVKFTVSFIVAAVAGLLIGMFFGGLSIIMKLIPALIIVFVAPIASAIYFGWPLHLLSIGVNSGSMFLGYLAGSLISVVLLPVKVLGKIMKTFFSLFGGK